MDEQAEMKHVRKRLYVTDKAPALSIDSDGYVRCGLSGNMGDNDKLILAIVLSLKNEAWKNKMIAKVGDHMVGKTTETSRVITAFNMIGG